MKSTGRQCAILALVAVTSCSTEDEVVLTVTGDFPSAVALFARPVGDDGIGAKVYSAGDAEKPVKLPATIYLRLSHSKWVGAVVWLADAAGTIVAQGHSERCAELAASAKYGIALAPAPDGWSPATADGCRCDPTDPLGPMCRMTSADGGAPGDAMTEADAQPNDAGDQTDATAAPDAGADAAAPPDAAAETAPPPDAARDAPADSRDAAPDTRDAAAPDRASDVGGPDLPPAQAANAIFGFETTAPDWSSADTTLLHDTGVHTEGAASLAFTTGGTTTLRSRAFATKDLGAMGSHMVVDLFVNEKQDADANTEMWVDCESAAAYGVYMGYKALAGLKVPGWTALSYTMPAVVKQALSGDFKDCQVWFQLVGKGLFRYDNLRFAP